ncbi:GntR family transcriptional regulator [Agrobacterium tumefaciens]|uniref:GntR family transcriptional regulator n=1 Tax=Agrobacterium tumefaciens TaxID=358 RepID=UPI000B3F939F|nr:GntR family transcriptional regulator [Agrobacterium tumefaciens]NSY04423.1 GntR family transcriptional regulator [Agrobacterium tumefaciens]OVE86854.1 GntR family transcriptional regulator [Agrobacterium tumefaciens]
MIRSPSKQTNHRRYEIAEHFLRENIESGRLPPGFVLLEGPIAEILQTSRAPVQRALTKLETDRLVHRFNGRGFLVGPGHLSLEPNRSDIQTLGLVVPQHVDEALQSRSSWERIYNTVEHDVAGCVVFGLYRIVEIELAEHFRVSRTVVRDVLSRLQERGLVRKNQSSHWIAGPLTAQSIKDHFSLRRMLEPSALKAAMPHMLHDKVQDLFSRMKSLEAAEPSAHFSSLEELQSQMIELCVLTTPLERMRELIRNNLLPVTAAERLLRHLGLPDDPTAITEMRLVVELVMRGATDAAAAMLEAHLDAAMNRMIAQLKIVAVLPTPTSTAGYLTKLE